MGPVAPQLLLQWATGEATRFACKRWHYARSMPAGKCARIGVWEHGRFVGVVVFSWGANHNLGTPYGLSMLQCCELVRVALDRHETPVSRIVAIALRILRRSSPGVRLVVSFADPVQGHLGAIYQAGGWVYTGRSNDSFEYRMPDGQRLQKRAYTGGNYGQAKMPLPPGAVRVSVPGKHRYLMPLDDLTRAKIMALSVPPPRAKDQATGHPPVLGGETPTRALHPPAPPAPGHSQPPGL